MMFERITMVVLFCNIILSILLPNYIFNDGLFYTYDGNGYSLGNDIQDAAGTLDDDTASAIGNFGFIDIIKLIFAGLEMFVRFLFATFIVLYNIGGILSLIIGIPLGLAYFIGAIKFVRG